MNPPQFFYFDLGKVLLQFSRERMVRQLAELTACDAQRIRQVLFEQDLQRRYERGEISDEEFYELFCRQTGTRADYGALREAASDIFCLNYSLLPVVAQLHQVGCRLGILSNTCACHWEHCHRRFAILSEAFSVYALSYQLHKAKPEAAMFQAAAELAGVPPPMIFFVDDTPEHVAGAKAVGFDAVIYTTTAQLVAELRQRAVSFNY